MRSMRRVVGYGIIEYNSLVDRDWSLASYDHVFDTEEEAWDFYHSQVNSGYGDKLSCPDEVYVYDDVEAFLNNKLKEDEPPTLSEFLKLCYDYGCIPTSIMYSYEVAVVQFTDYEFCFDAGFSNGEILFFDYKSRCF